MQVFIGICKEKGNRVAEPFALGYALDRILTNGSERQEFIEWYFSGNWIIQNEEEQKHDI